MTKHFCDRCGDEVTKWECLTGGDEGRHLWILCRPCFKEFRVSFMTSRDTGAGATFQERA